MLTTMDIGYEGLSWLLWSNSVFVILLSGVLIEKGEQNQDLFDYKKCMLILS